MSSVYKYLGSSLYAQCRTFHDGVPWYTLNILGALNLDTSALQFREIFLHYFLELYSFCSLTPISWSSSNDPLIFLCLCPTMHVFFISLSGRCHWLYVTDFKLNVLGDMHYNLFLFYVFNFYVYYFSYYFKLGFLFYCFPNASMSCGFLFVVLLVSFFALFFLFHVEAFIKTLYIFLK